MQKPAPLALVVLTSLVAGCGSESPTEPPPEAGQEGFRTPASALVRGLGGTSVLPLLSVGDTVVTGGQPLAPAPDGIGIRPHGGHLILHVSHELWGVPRSDGGEAYRGGRVARLALDTETLDIVSHDYAIDGTEEYGPFSAGTWVGADEGFGDGRYLTGEKRANGVQLAVDARGSVTEMPWMGRFNHDSQIAVPGFPSHTVLLGFDDSGGQDVAESELYMYVAGSPEGALTGAGQLYVLASGAAAHVGELAPGAEVTGHWIPVPDEVARDFRALQTFAHDRNALSFVRLEDGFYDKRPGASPAAYFYDTGRNSITNGTGEPLDKWGSIYRIAFDRPSDPGGGTATLTLLARSDGPDAGWASPDNGDMRADGVVMLQEDPAAGVWDRPPSVYRLELASDGGLADPVGTRVAEVADPACPGADCADVAQWETSGIVDASDWLGHGMWVFSVMAHDKAVPSLGLTAENGQILLLDEGP